MQRASSKIGRRRRIIVGILAIFLGLGSFAQLAPTAEAAGDVSAAWKNSTTVTLSGGALKSPVDMPGDFVGNVYGTPAGSQTFMSAASSPVETSFGCKISTNLNIYPDSAGKLDFTKGQLIFTTGSPSTCSRDQLSQNIPGLSQTPDGGTANIGKDISVGNVAARNGSTGGSDTAATKAVKVVAGMGPASDFTGLPDKDTFILCAATGQYANNKDLLDTDCLAKKKGTVTQGPVTSGALETLKDGKGPNGSDEKAWRGTIKGNNINPGNYVVCSVNFNACQFFNKAGGQVPEVTIDWGGAPNAKIPGTPTDSDSSKVNEPELGCDLTFDLTTIFSLKWLVCPVVNAATFTVGKLEDAINSLLTVDTKDIFDDSNGTNAYHKAWNSFRAFALGLIVIAALVMVVSQAIGAEILDAYTIRKILPRLLFAAIFITLSWDILEFLTNLSNDAGNGIRTLIYAPFQALNKNNQLGGGSSFVLTLIGTGGALAFGWIGLLSFAVTGLLAVLIAFAVIIFRKMLILLLLMMAPFAIACYILPSTQKGWSIWKDGLTSALVVFPIISGMIAIGRVFSITAFNGTAYNGPGGATVSQIIAVVAYFAPYFLISMAFRLAGGFIATIGGVANDRSRGAFDRLKNFRQHKVSDNMSKMAAGRRFQNSNPLARGFNAATGGAATFAKSRSKLGFMFNKDVRGAAFAQQRALNAMAYAGTDAAKVAAENDPLLRAQTYATEAEARRSMISDYGMYKKQAGGNYKYDEATRQYTKVADGTGDYAEDTKSLNTAIANAKANGGFGRDQQVNAARRLFSTGTGYDNLRQVHETVARVAGKNEDIASDILGFGNAETGNKGRLDLKAGYGKHMDLYRSIAEKGNLSNAEVDDATLDAIKGNEVLAMLRGKPIAVKNTAPVLRNALDRAQRTAADTSLGAAERDAARTEAGRLAGIIEQYQQNGMYASPTNVQNTDELVVQPTINTRQNIQQQASRTVLRRDPNSGRMVQDLDAAGNAIPNLGHDEDVERGYQQQKPRSMYDPNDPRFNP